MLQGKDGIKPGAKYGFQAIAEEDAAIYTGEAYVKGEEAIGGMSAFKVLNTFKGRNFVSYCTYKGEVIATRSPVQRIATELVTGAHEANGWASAEFKRAHAALWQRSAWLGKSADRRADPPAQTSAQAPTGVSQPNAGQPNAGQPSAGKEKFWT